MGRYCGRPPAPVFVSLLRLQTLAFWRAPYLAGRLALGAVKAAGVLYAVGAAAILGVVLPDLLGVVAPGTDTLQTVEGWALPALGALTGLRLLFQNVPTRGARAFLLLPVSRRRVAGGVLARSLASPFNVAPLAFAVPFAVRSVGGVAGPAETWGWAVAVGAVVLVSHFALVVWKTQLGARPVAVLAGLGVVVGLVGGAELAMGGVLAAVRGGDVWMAVALGALAFGIGATALAGIERALSLDAPARRSRRRTEAAGFGRPGVRAFLDLDARMLARTRYPRGIVVNAVLLSVALTVVATLGADLPSDLILVFSAGALAGSVGQFALPFAAGHYDRLTTLPGAFEAFVRAKWAAIASATLALGAVQLAVVLALDPGRAWLIGVAVLFGLGVLAPAALWGSTLGPKPVDLSDRVAFNYKVQSFGAQAAVGGTAALAAGVIGLAGPRWGPLAAAGLGVLGLASSPAWLGALVRRVHRTRHAVGARFRATL